MECVVSFAQESLCVNPDSNSFNGVNIKE